VETAKPAVVESAAAPPAAEPASKPKAPAQESPVLTAAASPRSKAAEPAPVPASKPSPDRDPQMRAAAPIRGGTHSLTRALGLKIGRIFIDAGHGGHDTGTIGPTGLTEKEVTLDIAHRIGEMVSERMGSEVIYSRTDDTFIPLEGRVAMANKAGADLFLSVHLNSSTAKSATGIETYYLNFTSDPEALKVAARENSGAQETIANLQGIVRKIALQEKLDESKEFAGRMQATLRKSLLKGMNRKAVRQYDRGVKTAPFVVLIGANMPSILTEVTFLSNPAEEKRLRTPEHRQKLAEALFAGLSSYVDSLSGVKVAAPHTPGSEPASVASSEERTAPAKAESTPKPSPRKALPAKQVKPETEQPEDVALLH
jgi:N-acetylmuramoyl-L-alanine amidase